MPQPRCATARRRCRNSTACASTWCGAGRRFNSCPLRRPRSPICSRSQARDSSRHTGRSNTTASSSRTTSIARHKSRDTTACRCVEERGIAFLDEAGNAYLNHPPLLIWVKGQRPKEKLNRANPTTRTFNPSGLQVIFPLLCHPEWANRPYREIAALAGVAHGTVGWVLAELPKLGFLAEVGGKRRLLQPERLLHQWEKPTHAHYARDC